MLQTIVLMVSSTSPARDAKNQLVSHGWSAATCSTQANSRRSFMEPWTSLYAGIRYDPRKNTQMSAKRVQTVVLRERKKFFIGKPYYHRDTENYLGLFRS